jgi:hypothetical protein
MHTFKNKAVYDALIAERKVITQKIEKLIANEINLIGYGTTDADIEYAKEEMFYAYEGERAFDYVVCEMENVLMRMYDEAILIEEGFYD